MACRPKPLPAVTAEGGCCVITNCEAGAAVTVMALVVAPLRPLLETLECVAGGGLVQRQSGEGGHAVAACHG